MLFLLRGTNDPSKNILPKKTLRPVPQDNQKYLGISYPQE